MNRIAVRIASAKVYSRGAERELWGDKSRGFAVSPRDRFHSDVKGPGGFH